MLLMGISFWAGAISSSVVIPEANALSHSVVKGELELRTGSYKGYYKGKYVDLWCSRPIKINFQLIEFEDGNLTLDRPL
jgi:hypothetical protein